MTIHILVTLSFNLVTSALSARNKIFGFDDKLASSVIASGSNFNGDNIYGFDDSFWGFLPFGQYTRSGDNFEFF